MPKIEEWFDRTKVVFNCGWIDKEEYENELKKESIKNQN